MTGVPRQPVEPAVVDPMNQLAELLSDTLPPNYGFALLVFKKDVDKGFMNYISDCKREDMIAALKELLANFEGRGHEPPRSKQ